MTCKTSFKRTMPKQAQLAGQIVNRGEMAGILGISPTTLDRYVQAGCPVLEKGSGRREYRFNTAEVPLELYSASCTVAR